MHPLDLTLLVPLRAAQPDLQLMTYLRDLSQHVEDVILVDGSEPEVWHVHHARLGARVRHLRTEVEVPNGKVANVCTGLRHARHEIVVIADDDVRWDRPTLVQALGRLGPGAVLRPQNYFDPRPWHAWWDTGRTLIQRALGGDWPGTLVVRASHLPDGYAGDCVFENLELVRTVRANGGREVVAFDVMVRRLPPSTRKFVEQRVRQAYDELARPWFLLVELSLLPAAWLGGRRVRGSLVLGAVGLAELGRRRPGGRARWPGSASLAAVPWLIERSITAWLAVAARARGGVRFGSARLRHAAHRHRSGPTLVPTPGGAPGSGSVRVGRGADPAVGHVQIPASPPAGDDNQCHEPGCEEHQEQRHHEGHAPVVPVQICARHPDARVWR